MSDAPLTEALPEAPRLDYFGQAVQPLLPVVRVVALVGIVLGLIRVAFLPVQVLNLQYEWESATFAKTEFLRVSWILSLAVPFVLASTLVAAAAGCLRMRPRSRRLLLVWAWASLVWIVFGAATNAYYAATNLPPQAATFYTASVIATQVEQWAPALTLPLVVLALFTREPIREAFDKPRHFSS